MDTDAPSDSKPTGILRGGLALIRNHWRAYLLSHAAYYGMLIVGLAIVAFTPGLQQTLHDAIGEAFTEGGPLGFVGEAYLGGQALRAVLLTFVVNLLLGTLLEITLPSLIVPFSGWLVGLYRALLWGFIFFPSPEMGVTTNLLDGVLLVLLLLLEGEGYVLGMFAALLQGRSFLFYRRMGYETLGKGYLAGLKHTALLYIPIIVVLIVAAIYEVLIAVVLV